VGGTEIDGKYGRAKARSQGNYLQSGKKGGATSLRAENSPEGEQGIGPQENGMYASLAWRFRREVGSAAQFAPTGIQNYPWDRWRKACYQYERTSDDLPKAERGALKK